MSPAAFHGTPRHRENAALDEAVHARDTDCREQRSDGRRDQADEECDQLDRILLVPRVQAHRADGYDGEEEDDRQRREQDVERNLVGCLLTRGAFDERDHPVHERTARCCGDFHDDPVGENRRTTGDGAAIATGFTDYRGGFTGDRRFVHGGNTFDHVAVAGDDLAGNHDHPVADHQFGAGNRFDRAAHRDPMCCGVLLDLAQAGRLSLASPFGHGFGEVREDHREPEPQGDHP